MRRVHRVRALAAGPHAAVDSAGPHGALDLERGDVLRLGAEVPAPDLQRFDVAVRLDAQGDGLQRDLHALDETGGPRLLLVVTSPVTTSRSSNG